jgi:hypothetical protein
VLALHFQKSPLLSNLKQSLSIAVDWIRACVSENAAALETSFDRAPDGRCVGAHCAAVDLLVRFDLALIAHLFFSNRGSFLLWLGRVVISDFRAFVWIAIRIRASSEAQVICVTAYFKQLRRPDHLEHLPTLGRILLFVSDVIGLLPRQPCRFELTAFSAVMLNAVQLLPLDTHNVTQLIAAVSAFYVSQIKQRGKAFKDAFGDFRTAILPLFVLRLSSIQSVELLKAVQCLLFSYGPDRSIFVQSFLWTLFSHMSAIDNNVSGIAWSIFRQWVLTDPAPERCIFKVEELRDAFLTLAKSAEDNEGSCEELAMLREGVVGDAKAKRSVRARGSGLLVKMKLAGVPGDLIIERLIAMKREG